MHYERARFRDGWNLFGEEVKWPRLAGNPRLACLIQFRSDGKLNLIAAGRSELQFDLLRCRELIVRENR